ncbi:amino acid ABC transporter permease [Shinella sp. PSBB067]|uniref:amino acid ABC transporter permease n=1 Tax=Shinella sp. PSBB067 TaxID=2715959 RepID=UPI00193B75E0|nr:amino acid ABC transporter permease [Shinella sp. PSBB067]QRI63819.1 amino acid ABC transporter permease [Shinella sp. PSBB067]
MFELDWLLRGSILLFLLKGFGVTLALAFLSGAIAFCLAIFLAAARTSRSPFISLPAAGYIELVRALPLMLLIFGVFFLSKPFLGIALTPFQAGIIALSAFMAALLAETLRAGLNSIEKGLIEAGKSQGLSSVQVFRLIQFPLMVRRMAPALVSQFIALLKATSLTVVIGVPELLDRATVLSNRPPFQPLPVYLLIAFAFFATNYLLSLFSNWLQKRSEK